MQRNDDERLLAMVAHASAVMNVVNLLGVLITMLILITQREQSRYVRAHALQSLVYQGVMFLLVLLLVLTWSVCMGGSLLPMLLRPELYQDGGLPFPFWLALLSGMVPLSVAVLAALYALYGAVQVYLGAPFQYALIGRIFASDLAPANAPTLPTAATPVPVPPAPPEVPAQPEVLPDPPPATPEVPQATDPTPGDKAL